MLKEKHDLYQNRTFNVLIFFFLILLTRLLFKSHYLYEWDSVHYALAIEKLDILWHQPHPPGYILYVFLLKISALIFAPDEFVMPDSFATSTKVGGGGWAELESSG